MGDLKPVVVKLKYLFFPKTENMCLCSGVGWGVEVGFKSARLLGEM